MTVTSPTTSQQDTPTYKPHWSTSLLTKMTGVVLWTLMLLMFLLALIFIHQHTQRLKTQLLSRGEVTIHQIAERYQEFVRFESNMTTSHKGLPSSSLNPAENSDPYKKILDQIERHKDGLQDRLLMQKIDGEIQGIGLLTEEGKYYSAGDPQYTGDFLNKKCAFFLNENRRLCNLLQEEDQNIYTLTYPIFTQTGPRNAVISLVLSKRLLSQQVKEMRKEVFLMVTVVVILLSFPILYLLKKWVIQPIRDVTEASQEISDGNFNMKIPVRSHDEIGLLAANFNKMSASLITRDAYLKEGCNEIQSIKEFYNSIISNATVGIMTLNHHGTVAFENPALTKMLYCFSEDPTERLGKTFDEIPELQGTRINEVLRKIMSGETVEEEGFQYTHSTGEQKTFALKGIPLLNEKNFLKGSLFVFVDNTIRTQLEARLKESNLLLEKTVEERTHEISRTNEKLQETILNLHQTNQELLHTSQALKKSNEKIVEANRMKTVFLASMSHELRTPLNAIIGFSDLILSGIDGSINHKQREDLQSISKSGRNLLHLISDILDLSKIEAGKVLLKRKMIPVQPFVYELYPLATNMIGTKPVQFKIHIDKEIDFVYADENKLHQILLNLISNAIKFTPRGEINLLVQKKETEEDTAIDYAEFIVEDTGIGIQNEDIQNIFNEFIQIDQSSRNLDGSGLGLSITRKLVELGGGNVWVESGNRQGSRFHFTVPTSSTNIALAASLQTT